MTSNCGAGGRQADPVIRLHANAQLGSRPLPLVFFLQHEIVSYQGRARKMLFICVNVHFQYRAIDSWQNIGNLHGKIWETHIHKKMPHFFFTMLYIHWVHSLQNRLHCLLNNVNHKNLIPSTFPLTDRNSIFKVLPIQKCRDIRKVL